VILFMDRDIFPLLPGLTEDSLLLFAMVYDFDGVSKLKGLLN